MYLHGILLGSQQVISSLSHSGSAAAAGAGSSMSILSACTPDAGIAQVHPLFGSSLPWNTTGRVTWVSVDDRVRGGSSRSTLETRTKDHEIDAIFAGNLDTSTLGGAGFASVSSVFDDDDESFDLSEYDGLVLNVTYADEKRYALTVKDTVPAERPDGRMESGISYEAEFQADPGSPRRHELVKIPWASLNPTYRGRAVDAKPVNPGRVLRLGVMMRSFFDKQQGAFELTLHSISAYKVASETSKQVTDL